jgi:DegV family protein with EDD domain
MKIHRIDIKNVSIGQGLIVLKTARLIEQQPDIEPEELVAWIESLVTRTRFCFVPGNLDYLKAGGRVSNAQYIGAKLLKLKPLIEVIDGLMLSTKKYRGSMDSIITAMMTEYFKKHTIDKELMIFVYACTLDNSLKNTMEQIAKKEGVKNIIWLQTGGVITSHSGPGGVGISGVEV